jgi:signal transduction histidine kinase
VLRSLHARLAIALLGLLLLLAGLNVAWTFVTTRLHEQEVMQSLHRDLARHIVDMKRDLLLDSQGRIQRDSLGEIFHWLMVVNPRVEFYVIDLEGRLLAYDAPPGRIRRQQVDLQPISAFLRADRKSLPILGDDPRHEERRKIFSVALLAPAEDQPPVGYLYIILASEQADSAWDLLQSSYLWRLSVLAGGAAFALALVAGLLLLWRLTRPLRRLARRMEELQIPGATEAPLLAAPSATDELKLLEQRFASMAARIERQVEQIQEIERSRRELIASVSHDLRTPITGVRGYLETVILKQGALPESERQEYLKTALEQAERLARLVEELFELTKLESHEVHLRMETFSLAELVQDNVQRYRLQAERRGVRLEGQLSPEVPFVQADIGLLERVLQNLIENALRFTPENGEIQVQVAEEGGRVVVRVRDTGCGIASEELPKIFDRFYRAESSSEGAGLGLAIAQRIVEIHGAHLQVESTVGRGTCFYFALEPATAA